jgi:hypothetical protein
MRHYVMSSVFVILAGSAAADTLLISTPRTLSDFGYVQDVNLGHFGENVNCPLNDQSCAPTSWTNSLVYLQNKYGIDLAGLEIAGSDYSAWTETVETLRSSEFMNTTPEGDGTTAYGQINGLEKFLIHQGAGPLATSYQAMAASFMLTPTGDDNQPLIYPEWVMRGAPTLNLLHQWLEADAAVVINILYAADDGTLTESGHVLALVGIEWHDYNDNGIVDKWTLVGTEETAEAFLLVIDPIDPTFGDYTPDGWLPVGPAKHTKIHVWQEPNPELNATFGMLNIEYRQYKADCGQPYPFAESFPNGNDTYGSTAGWLSGAGALNIIGGPGGSCCLVTGCDVLTETKCGELGGSWALSGSCDDCPEYCEGDTNHDGYVNMDDLLSMLGNWGACP